MGQAGRYVGGVWVGLVESISTLNEVPPPTISKELKKRWSHFIQKVYEKDPLICLKWALALPLR
jgi:hypothetical protein